jgi:asparagine synthase (glutamine-hydrolysing)
MCGIAGLMSLDERPVSLVDVRRMCAALFHRGPDEDGYYLGSHVGLGMRRLRIIDLETGSQPVRNEDGTVWVVLNGEIYNYRQLRRGLERTGHRFYTASDTETIVHLYEEQGVRCVESLRGMFAFALWDERRRQLLLARDRLGIKPLYFALLGKRLVFSSELKGILQLPEVDRRLSWNALDHYLAFLTTPLSESIIEGVRKLEPAHLLVASPGRPLRTERYWSLKMEPDPSLTEEECEARIRDLLEESVKLHLESDVPLGAFLSGGIDSSAVVATMARVSPGPVKTFSIGFEEHEFDERHYARMVAKRLGTEHTELLVKPESLGSIEDLVWHLDEPFGDASALPTYAVSRLAAEHVKVVMSGDGGDELFAGYDRYVVEARERRWQLGPRPVRRALERLGGWIPEGVRGRNFLLHHAREGARRYLDACTLFKPEQKLRLLRPEAREHLRACDPWRARERMLEDANCDWLSALQYLDLRTYLPLDILTKVDRMSMAHSLEARVPLLDHRLVEFAATIPPAMKLRHGSTKYIFKRALRGLLPSEILARPKRGFAVPLGYWFRGPLTDVVRDFLLSERFRERGIFDPAYVRKLLQWHAEGRELEMQIWTLLSFEIWCRTFLDQQQPARPAVRSRPAAHLAAAAGL